MQIRRALESDAEPICAIHAASIRAGAGSHYAPDQISSWHGTRTPEAYVGAIRTKVVLVAESLPDVLGFAQLDPARAAIEAVYVAPPAMRRGVGSRLLAGLEAHAASLGLEQLELDASLNAVAFYERAGYTALREHHHQLAAGVVLPCVRMVKSWKSAT